MTDLNKLRKELAEANLLVEKLKAQIAQEVAVAVKSVTVKKNADSVTLIHGARVLNVKKNSRGRLAVKENRKTIDGDYPFGLYALRQDIAEGRL